MKLMSLLKICKAEYVCRTATTMQPHSEWQQTKDAQNKTTRHRRHNKKFS